MARSSRIRMPRVVLPTRRRGAGSRGGGSEAPTKTATQATEPKAATKADTGAAVAVAGAKAPDLNERIAGLQGWMAEIERRQGRITYFGAAAVLIAIAAAGAALYFGITAKNDSATKGDVDALSKKVDGLQGAVTKNSRDTQATLNDTVNRLQASIAAAQKQQAQQAATISTLQSQVAAGALGKGAAGATPGTAPTTSTPGATGGKTKTTP